MKNIPQEERQPRALVVDNTPGVLLVITLMLKAFGFNTVASPNPEMALRIIYGKEYLELLIADQVMPRITGKELIKQASKWRPELHCMLITADWRVTPPEGDVLFLKKPFHMSALAEALRTKTGLPLSGGRW